MSNSQNTTDEKAREFLSESNAIENVFDKDSLQQAVYAWEYLSKQKEMSIGVVLKIHKILMLNQPILPSQKGYLRRVSVFVGMAEMMKPPFIEEALKIWCMNAWLSPENWKLHHVRYEKIHPFIDGNGRTGRMLMNWQRLKAGLPLLIIYEDEKEEYYGWFR